MDPSAERPTPVNFLPLSPEVAQKTLQGIEQAPDKTYLEEVYLIGSNQGLSELLSKFSSRLTTPMNFEFEEGANRAHRLLKKQAEEENSRMPKVSIGIKDALIASFLEKYQNQVGSIDLEGIWREQAGELKSLDRVFYDAVYEMAKHRAFSDAYMGGVSLL